MKRYLAVLMHMDEDEASIQIVWDGPYSWPGFEKANGLPPLPAQPGVYLQTVEYKEGYLIYAAGLTRRTIPQRFREHARKYKSGDYTILDMPALQQGIRKEIWHGWGWSPEKRAQFEERKPSLLDAVQKQLAGFCIFVADVGIEPRIMERLEASVMQKLYRQPPPLCDIPDKGMMLAPRRASELPMITNSACAVLLYGLPSDLEI